MRCGYFTRRRRKARAGLESIGYTQSFEKMLTELGHELWVGDAAEFRAANVHHPKTDIPDARLILQLLDEQSFPRLWLPTAEDRDARRLLWHREDGADAHHGSEPTARTGAEPGLAAGLRTVEPPRSARTGTTGAGPLP